MAYRGGNINFTVKGDAQFNLDNLDFRVMIYPDRHPEEAKTVLKSQMTKLNTNHYAGTISYDETKTMHLGLYSIEVLIIESSTSRSVYKKAGAFPMYESASEDIA